MIIGEKEFEQIIVTDNKGGVLVVISDTEIIEHDNIKIIMDEV